MPTIISTQNEISTNDHNIITEIFLCDICGKKYSHKSSIRIHIQAIHLGMQVSCKKCLKNYKDPKALSYHNQRDHQNIICLICKKKFTSSSCLKIHNDSVHKKIRFQCEKCLRKYSSPQSLRKHINADHFKIRVTCKYCPKTFTQSSSLKYHINNEHLNSQIPKYTCNICSKVFKNQNLLKYHMKTKHLDKCIECKICNKKYHFLRPLWQHSFEHREFKPFNCSSCDYKTVNKQKYKTHLMRHNIVYNEENHGYKNETTEEVLSFVQ
jgi:KRAB domain-containing zinc finger protein